MLPHNFPDSQHQWHLAPLPLAPRLWHAAGHQGVAEEGGVSATWSGPIIHPHPAPAPSLRQPGQTRQSGGGRCPRHAGSPGVISHQVSSESLWPVSCSQGTYCLVESVLSERDIAPAGEQLVILLGFKTTNNVETEVIMVMSWSVWSDIYIAAGVEKVLRSIARKVVLSQKFSNSFERKKIPFSFIPSFFVAITKRWEFIYMPNRLGDQKLNPKHSS